MGLLKPVALKLGTFAWTRRMLPRIVVLDKLLQRVSRGRFGLLSLAGLPWLTLTVPGRKSGIPRSTPLLCTPYDGGWLIAGSAFGAPKPPVWVANLRATETATVLYRGRERTVAWRELEGADRERAWAALVEHWPNYERYAAEADRVIPIFDLTEV